MSNVTEPSPPRWLKPMNRLVLALGRIGVPAGPSQVLTVPGRKSGQPRSTPMTPFDHDGGLYRQNRLGTALTRWCFRHASTPDRTRHATGPAGTSYSWVFPERPLPAGVA